MRHFRTVRDRGNARPDRKINEKGDGEMALVRDSFVWKKSEEEKKAFKEKIKDDLTYITEEPFLATKAEVDEARAARKAAAEAEKKAADGEA